jgi:hypothetical protein
MPTQIAAQVVGPQELPGKAVFPEEHRRPTPVGVHRHRCGPSWRGGEVMKLATVGLMVFEVVEPHPFNALPVLFAGQQPPVATEGQGSA